MVPASRLMSGVEAIQRAWSRVSPVIVLIGQHWTPIRRNMHAVIETHRAEIRAIAERFGFKDVCVFGSMARGDADERSDVDLLVTLPPGKSGLILGALLMDVQDLLGRRVDVVTKRCLHPAFRGRVLNEAQVL